MARRAGIWVLGGATAAASALIARPDAYRWLRRTAGLGGAEPTTEALPIAHDDAADDSFDTREARLSLRARLHEAEVPVQDEAEAADEAPAEAKAEPVKVAVGVGAEEKRPAARKINSRPRPAREPVEPLRRNVEEARTRMRQSARKAAQENGPAA
jgi:hypothetical protein